MSQKLTVDGFEWMENTHFKGEFVKCHKKKTVLLNKCLKLTQHILNKWGLFLLEKMKINKQEKIICNFNGKGYILYK